MVLFWNISSRFREAQVNMLIIILLIIRHEMQRLSSYASIAANVILRASHKCSVQASLPSSPQLIWLRRVTSLPSSLQNVSYIRLQSF